MVQIMKLLIMKSSPASVINGESWDCKWYRD